MADDPLPAIGRFKMATGRQMRFNFRFNRRFQQPAAPSRKTSVNALLNCSG